MAARGKRVAVATIDQVPALIAELFVYAEQRKAIHDFELALMSYTKIIEAIEGAIAYGIDTKTTETYKSLKTKAEKFIKDIHDISMYPLPVVTVTSERTADGKTIVTTEKKDGAVSIVYPLPPPPPTPPTE